jgi:hypothetical protein
MTTEEALRREMTKEINSKAAERQLLEAKYGQVWDTDQLRADFDVVGFLAPFTAVRRKRDGKKGSLMFQHDPRYYFSFTED